MQAPSDSGTPTAQSLATLLHLARRARHASTADELAFVIVNEGLQLLPYRQAVLWLGDQGLRAISGVSAPDPHAPFVQWIGKLSRHLSTPPTPPRRMQADELPQELTADWDEFLPAYLLWLPFPGKNGALLLAREEPFSDLDLALAAEWADIAAQALKPLTEPARGSWRSLFVASEAEPAKTTAHDWRQILRDLWRRPLRRYTLLAAVILLIPVRQTVLAPGELVPAHPAVIRAPLDGVIDEVLVEPNQAVTAGQPLFSLDRTTLTARLAVAQQALSTAQAEYRQQAQRAVFDDAGKARLASLRGAIAEREAELGYLQQQLERGVIAAPEDGVVLFDGPSEWIGRPVTTGEAIARVANPQDAEIEAWLAPGDLIPLDDAAPVRFFLNASPLNPLQGQLRYLQYDASERPDASYAYRLRATLEHRDGELPRVGLMGTVKISGERVPLAYWMLRRPLAAARQLTGW